MINLKIPTRECKLNVNTRNKVTVREIKYRLVIFPRYREIDSISNLRNKMTTRD